MIEQQTIITVTGLPDDPRPLAVRERLALKALLRRFGLRCLSIRDAAPDAASDDNSKRLTAGRSPARNTDEQDACPLRFS